jgi:hypothetical protein
MLSRIDIEAVEEWLAGIAVGVITVTALFVVVGWFG